MSRINKARFWTGVLYPENMRKNWELEIGDIVQYPYAYCCHSKDKDSKSEHRKDHIHLILCFPNTTTYNHALTIFNLLSLDGKKAINKCEAIINIRNMYDYLIHDTETCRKLKKELYSKDDRITGNNFDIGAYEQLGVSEKNDICKELCMLIYDKGFSNFSDFFSYVISTYDDSNYFEILKSNSGLFERLTRGNFQKLQFNSYENNTKTTQNNTEQSQKQHENNTEQHENNTQNSINCCPDCGSISLKKCGKTQSLSQRWQCKDCQKTFVGYQS